MMHPFDPLPAPERKALPSGACPRDPTEPVFDTCFRCGDFLCLRCAQYVRGEVYCRNCKPLDLTPAGPGQRFRGQLCDTLFYCLAMMIALVPGLVFKKGELTMVFMPLGVLVCFAYNSFLFITSGQSLGKRIVGTRVVTPEGAPVAGMRTVLLRHVLPTMLGYIPGIGSLFGLLDALFVFGEPRRCIHDLLANTIVVSADATPRVYAKRA
jgi:uncharacterized RDD family membrane protein YckC